MSRSVDDDELVAIVVQAAQPSGAAVGLIDDGSGRRVLVGPFDPCGQCDVCRRGGAAVCAHARRRERGPRIRAAGRWLVTLGDGLELPGPAAAAVAGDVALAYTLYARTNLAPREPAVVIGTTPIARFLVDILLAKSITPTVLASRADDAWCAHLARVGAVVAHDDGEPRATIAAAIAAQGLGTRPWRLLATDPDVAGLAASLAGPRATLTVLAPPDRPPPAIDGAVVAREVTVIGVAGAHPDLVVEVAAMVVRGEIDLVGGVAVDGVADDRTRASVTTCA